MARARAKFEMKKIWDEKTSRTRKESRICTMTFILIHNQTKMEITELQFFNFTIDICDWEVCKVFIDEKEIIDKEIWESLYVIYVTTNP